MKIKMLLCAGAMAMIGATQAGAGEVVSGNGLVAVMPVSAEAMAVRVKSVHGWTCNGVFAQPKKPGAAVNFPLSCTDDVDGEALMSVEDGRAALLFKREDGSKGSAAVTVY